jgi:hypothetical protein
LGQPVFRPFVPVSLAIEGASTPELEGLIDTGADAILASDLLADELGLDLADNEGEELHPVGRRTVVARYETVSLRLHHHDDSSSRCEWEAPVGFVDGWHSFGLVLLGSVGFLDHFTVTASRDPRRSQSRIATALMIASASSWLNAIQSRRPHPKKHPRAYLAADRSGLYRSLSSAVTSFSRASSE